MYAGGGEHQEKTSPSDNLGSVGICLPQSGKVRFLTALPSEYVPMKNHTQNNKQKARKNVGLCPPRIFGYNLSLKRVARNVATPSRRGEKHRASTALKAIYLAHDTNTNVLTKQLRRRRQRRAPDSPHVVYIKPTDTVNSFESPTEVKRTQSQSGTIIVRRGHHSRVMTVPRHQPPGKAAKGGVIVGVHDATQFFLTIK